MINERLALQTHLLDVISATVTDWENNDFEVPSLETPYYKVHLLRGQSDSLAIDTMDGMGQGILQVTLLYPSDKGTIPLETKAVEIMNHFVGKTLTETDTKVKMLKLPYFTMLSPTADRFIGAVSIPYTSTKI